MKPFAKDTRSSSDGILTMSGPMKIFLGMERVKSSSWFITTVEDMLASETRLAHGKADLDLLAGSPSWQVSGWMN